MVSRLLKFLFICLALSGLYFVWKPAYAGEDSIYPIDGPGTINLGKQGLVIGNPSLYMKFVEIIKHKPTIPDIYPSPVDVETFGPALEITYLNEKKEEVQPGAGNSSVYFMIGEKEEELWIEGGSEELSIWYYNIKQRIWQKCPTIYLSEKENNGKSDRLACFIIGNGIYILGKSDLEYYLAVGPQTIILGKQGVFVSNPPSNAEFIEIERHHPPIPAKFTFDIDLAYRGPALEINFRDKNKRIVTPGATLTSVYFNVSAPEVRIWEEGGPDEIAIWYYNINSKEWRMCPTRFVPEMQNNGKYDRLACNIMGNGYYVLGKMAFDPFFPLWFKVQGLELENRRWRFQIY
jgi:hypothetical protein